MMNNLTVSEFLSHENGCTCHDDLKNIRFYMSKCFFWYGREKSYATYVQTGTYSHVPTDDNRTN